MPAPKKAPAKGESTGGNSGEVVAVEVLKAIVERIERLNEEKAEIGESLKEVFAESKGNGFDNKTLRKIIRIRAQDRAKLLEEKATLDLYAMALGCEDLV